MSDEQGTDKALHEKGGLGIRSNGSIIIPEGTVRHLYLLFLGLAVGGAGSTGLWSLADPHAPTNTSVNKLEERVEGLAVEVRKLREDILLSRFTRVDHQTWVREDFRPEIRALESRVDDLERRVLALP